MPDITTPRVDLSRQLLIRYRTFRNTDPPLLADIWRTVGARQGFAQPMSVNVLEQLVFAKPYFDDKGLILAFDDDLPIGFAHASFGPNEDENDVSTESGTTNMLLLRPNFVGQGIDAELLRRSEAYLRARGAQVLYAGGIRPLNAFYLGLYGGSELPGVLDTDEDWQQLLCASDYRAVDHVTVWHHELSRFRPVVDRKQLQIRRRLAVSCAVGLAPTTWWDASTMGPFTRTRFDLVPRMGGPTVATATFWDMELFASSWGVRAAGLVDLETEASSRRQGMASALLGEAFRELEHQGFFLVEVQTMERNTAAKALYEKLGFHLVGRGSVFRKNGQSDATSLKTTDARQQLG